MKKSVLRTLSRILIAIVGTLFLIAIILAIEAIFGGEKSCQTQEAWILCQIRESVLLGVVEGFSILVALILFFLEAPERGKQAHYEAWKVIDTAHGVQTSYARFQALQDLNEDGVSLRGLHAPGADLKGIHLEAADLSNANLVGANLVGANLSKANLSNANLMGANLSNANLSNANMIGANLSNIKLIDADLISVNMIGADLSEAHLIGANLSKAYMGDTDLSQADFSDANLSKAKLFGIRNLTPEQVKVANRWKEANYDQGFRKQLGL